MVVEGIGAIPVKLTKTNRNLWRKKAMKKAITILITVIVIMALTALQYDHTNDPETGINKSQSDLCPATGGRDCDQQGRIKRKKAAKLS